MGVRLNKVLCELNIGIQTAVGFLKHHEELGEIKDDATPNTKISDLQYEALVKEFKGDKNNKSYDDLLWLFPKKAKETKPLKDTCPIRRAAPKGKTTHVEEAGTALENERKQYMTKKEALERIREIAHAEEPPQKDEVDYLKTVFYKQHIAEREAALKEYLDGGGDPDLYEIKPDPDEEAFKAEMGIIKERRAKFFNKQEQENLTRKLDIIEKIKAMITTPEDASKSYQEFKVLKQQWREIKDVPAEKANELQRDYKLYVEQFYDLLRLFTEQEQDERERLQEKYEQSKRFDENNEINLDNVGIKKKDEYTEVKFNDIKYDVFISYSRGNTEYVARLFDEMMTHNISAWFDNNKFHRAMGSEFVQTIRYGIDNSSCFLLIYTKEVEKSAFVIKEELEYAIARGKRTLIYPLDPVDMRKSQIACYINRMQWLDFGQGMTDSIYEDQSIFMIRVLLQYRLGHLTIAGNYEKLCGCNHDEFYNRNKFSLYVVNKSFFLSIPEKLKDELTRLGFLKNDFNKKIENHLKLICPDNVQITNKLFTFLDDHKDIYQLSVIHNRLANYLKQDKYNGISLPELDVFGFKDFVNIVTNMIACNLVLELKYGKTIFNGAELGVYNINENRTTNSEKHCVDMQLFYSDYFTYRCMTEMYHILCSINDAPFKLHNIHDVNTLAPFFCSLGMGGFLMADTKEGSSLLWRRRYTRSFSFDEIWHFPYDSIVNLQLDGITDNRGNLKIEKDNTVYIDTNKMFHRVLSEEIGAVPTNLEQNRSGIFEVGIIKSDRLEIEIISRATIKLGSGATPMGTVKKMFDRIDDTYSGFQQFSKMQFLYFNEDVLLGKMLSPEAHAMFNRLLSFTHTHKTIDNNRPPIFISYKRVDKQKVIVIKKRIEDILSIKCWFDVDGIESDAQFANVIIKAINECEVFLFMYSHAHSEINDLDNDWTIREINFAQKKKKRIVFVNIDGTQLTDWFEMMFGTKQQVDANSDESMNKLLSDIRNWLK